MHDFFFIAPAQDLLYSIFACIIGLCIGSFLNVVIYRIPKIFTHESENYVAEQSGQPLPHTKRFNLFLPRSHCPHCNHRLRFWENIPLFSYIFLKGACSQCKSPISLRYFLIELSTAILSGITAWHFGLTLQGFAALLFIYILIALTFIDLDVQLLPDNLTLSLLWLGLLVNLKNVFSFSSSAIIGAAVGYLSLWLVYWIFKLTTGKEGMGYGDFKLLAALGAWFGWQALPSLILISAVAGTLVGVTLILFYKHKRDIPIPFGPYLALAGLTMLFFKNNLTPLLLFPL
jgi:leader peptidase (prepilin peptidase)/N-methyltransferase